jgi:hypothetical protein
MPVLRIGALKNARWMPMNDSLDFAGDAGTALYDLASDPKQLRPFRDQTIEQRFARAIARALADHDAPPEMYRRYGLPAAVA